MQRVLAIDDEESVRQSYRMVLSGDFDVVLAPHGQAGLDYLDENNADVILLDLTMPGMSGEKVLRKLVERGNTIPVIVITASNTVTSAVEAMKLGAYDYITKPFDVDALRMSVRRVLEEARNRQELLALREADREGFELLTGSSRSFAQALAKARQAMNVDSAVLITGESGTGKDLVARSIHAGGKRAEGAYVPLSCCAIPAPLVESELFGYEKGAFTGADRTRIGKMKVADGGTIFLDEIGEMPLEAQAKLLRVLQDSRFYPVGSTKVIEVDIRVICATNRDLPSAIRDGIFREDLYYRINVLNIELPPLRERRDDIPELVAHFIAKHGPHVNAKVREIEPAAMNALRAYRWPGNIRELENSVERLLVYFSDQEIIRPEHVQMLLPEHTPDESATVMDEFEGLPLDEATRRMEAYLIRRALERADNVQSRAAELLGTTRRILKYKMDQLGIGG
jgi:DNA-binding NtrC family response regulator